MLFTNFLQQYKLNTFLSQAPKPDECLLHPPLTNNYPLQGAKTKQSYILRSFLQRYSVVIFIVVFLTFLHLPTPTHAQGPSFEEVQAIPTNGAADWKYFTIGDDSYLAVANSQNDSTYNIDSKIYKWNGTSFVEFQSIPTHGGRDWEYFTIGNDSYLAMANNRDSFTSFNLDSKIYKWNGTSFVEFQSIPTHGARDWEYFTIGGDSYLALTNHQNSSTSFNIDSKIYKWNGTNFAEFQSIPTQGANRWEYFMIGDDSYLVVANMRDNSTYNNIDSKIYKWNGINFVEFQTIVSNGASGWEFFTIDNENYLALANYRNDSTWNIGSKIYKWDGTSFIGFQTIPTNAAAKWEHFTVGNNSYLAVANYKDGVTWNVNSKIYKWNDTSFVEFQSIPTKGGYDWEYFTIGNDSYLAVTNGYDDTTFNINSKIYKATNFPTLTSITPNSAVANAGQVPVVIEGTHLQATNTLTIGTVQLLSVTLQSTTTLHAVVPVDALAEGTHDLTLNTGTHTRILTSAFTVLPPLPKTQVRAMVYFACDNNLALDCDDAFNRLEAAMLANPNLRIVALWDGADDGDSAYYLLKADDNPHLRANYTENVDYFPLGEVNTAHPSTLVKFANWSQAHYPGYYTFLSIVAHGGGWAPPLLSPQPRGHGSGPIGLGGLAWDEHPKDVMPTQSLATAFAYLTKASPLDVLYMDACLMSQIEVMAELAPYAEQIIAHENLTWTVYPYEHYLNQITINTTPQALAEHIATTFSQALPPSHPAQVGVIETEAINLVLSELDALATVLSNTLPASRQAISIALKSSMHLEENGDWWIDEEDNYIDLYDFAYQLTLQASLSPTIKVMANSLMNVIDAAVPINYARSGIAWPTYQTQTGPQYWDLAKLHGLSIYFPSYDEWRRPLYGPSALPAFGSTTAWDDFIQAWYTDSTPTTPPPCTIGVDCYPNYPAHLTVAIDPPLSVAPNTLVEIPITLHTVTADDDLQGLVLSIKVTDTTVLSPALTHQPRLGTFFPIDSYLYSSQTSTGWDIVLTTPPNTAATTGDGIVAYLPFYATNTGCVTLYFDKHTLANNGGGAISHEAIAGWVCVQENGQVTGEVSLQSRNTGQFSNTTVSLINQQGVLSTTLSNATGHFSFTAIPVGSYTLEMSQPLFVTGQRTINVSANQSTVLNAALWAGDVDGDGNGDGDVDWQDWYILAAAMVPVSDPAFDINADGQTDITDLMVLRANIGRLNMAITNPPTAKINAPSNQNIQNSVKRASGQCELSTLSSTALHINAAGILEEVAAVGVRLHLPPAMTIATVETEGVFETGFLSWHQAGDNLYLVTTPPQGTLLTEDDTLLLINAVNGNVAEITVEACNLIGLNAVYTVYLPLAIK